MANQISFSSKQLNQMKLLYESDTAIKKIAAKYDCSYNTIRNVAIRYNWKKGDSIAIIQAKVHEVLRQQDKLQAEQNTQILDNELQVIQASVSNNVLEHQILTRAQMCQLELIETIGMINLSAQSFVKANPSGTYIKSQGSNGNTYGVVADILTNIAQMIASTQRVIGNIPIAKHIDQHSNPIMQPQISVVGHIASDIDENDTE